MNAEFTWCTWRQREVEGEVRVEGGRERCVHQRFSVHWLLALPLCRVIGERQRKRKEYGFIWRSSRFCAVVAEHWCEQKTGARPNSQCKTPLFYLNPPPSLCYRVACESTIDTPGHINGWDATLLIQRTSSNVASSARAHLYEPE